MYRVSRSLLAAALLSLCDFSARAQTPDYSLLPVLDRPRPDYAPPGLRWGSFLVFPAILASAAFDDNIYATRRARTGDSLARVQPSFLLRSDWRVHSLDVFGTAEAVLYGKHAVENQLNGSLGLRGLIEVRRDFTIGYSAGWVRSHDDRGSGDGFLLALPFDKPVTRDLMSLGLTLNKRLGRATASLAVDVVDTRYQDNAILGSKVALSARDYTSAAFRGRLGYDMTAITQLFGEVAFEHRGFHAQFADSNGWRAIAGLRFEASRLLNGEVYGGYLERIFARPGPPDIGTYTYGARLSWLATPLLTVSLAGERAAQESYRIGSLGSYLQSTAALRADYEVRRDAIVSLRMGYEQDDFREPARRDRLVSLGAAMTLFLSRRLQVSLDYRFVGRLSDVSAADYRRNIYGASLRAQF